MIKENHLGGLGRNISFSVGELLLVEDAWDNFQSHQEFYIVTFSQFKRQLKAGVQSKRKNCRRGGCTEAVLIAQSIKHIGLVFDLMSEKSMSGHQGWPTLSNVTRQLRAEYALLLAKKFKQ